MSKEFEIVREFEVEATPEQVWEAVTTGTGGWLWPVEYEPRQGGAAPFGGTVTVWDPPRRLTGRVESPKDVPNQTFNQLDHVIEPREGGGSWVRYVHSGIFVDDWDNQYDGAYKHTDFYLHTLRQYLWYFAGRPITFATVDGPEAAGRAGAFEALSRALGVPDEAVEGTEVRVAFPGRGPVDAVVDYRTPYFLGLRGDDAMYRFFGRNHFGAVVGVSVHDFAPDADSERIRQAWQAWLTGLFV